MWTSGGHVGQGRLCCTDEKTWEMFYPPTIPYRDFLKNIDVLKVNRSALIKHSHTRGWSNAALENPTFVVPPNIIQLKGQWNAKHITDLCMMDFDMFWHALTLLTCFDIIDLVSFFIIFHPSPCANHWRILRFHGGDSRMDLCWGNSAASLGRFGTPQWLWKSLGGKTLLGSPRMAS